MGMDIVITDIHIQIKSDFLCPAVCGAFPLFFSPIFKISAHLRES